MTKMLYATSYSVQLVAHQSAGGALNWQSDGQFVPFLEHATIVYVVPVIAHQSGGSAVSEFRTIIKDSNMDISLLPLVPQVESILHQAGAVIMQHFRQVVPQQEKSLGDFVTAADLASQEILIAGLTPLVPQAQVIAEEQTNPVLLNVAQHSKQVASSLADSDYAWVIDPLDGTNNFRHGVARFAISVALTYQRQTVLGFIYDPVQRELFYAVKGQGVYRHNGSSVERIDPVQRLSTSSDSLHNRLIATNLKQLIYWPALVQEGAIWRKFGGAALDLAYVSQGWVDLAGYEGLHWWDWAAGALLVQEACLQFEQVVVPDGWGGGHRVLAGPPALVQRALAQLI